MPAIWQDSFLFTMSMIFPTFWAATLPRPACPDTRHVPIVNFVTIGTDLATSHGGIYDFEAA